MFNPKCLFGLNPKLDYIPGKWITSSPGDGPRLFTPGFIEGFHDIQEEANGIIYITAGKSPRNSGPGINTVFPFDGNIRRSNRTVTARWLPTKNFIDDHRFETSRMFNIGRLQEVLSEVLKNGAITFATDDVEEASLVLLELRDAISSQFAYFTYFKHNTSMTSISTSDSDNLVLLTTFVPLEYCIPIFNHRLVEGMGILLSAVSPRNTKNMGHLVVEEEMFLAVSNHSSNLHQVDGSVVRSIKLPDSSRTDHFAKVFAKEGERRKFRAGGLKKQPKKKPEEKKSKGDKTNWSDLLDKGNMYETTSTISFYNSSGTS
jgi:hypothetical protein